jgi:flagellar hook-basal body complex protein FliE
MEPVAFLSSTSPIPIEKSFEIDTTPFEQRPVGAVNGGMAFEDIVSKSISDVSAQHNAADAKVQALAAGAQDDLHGTMIAVKEAEITTHLVGTIRNKLLDAFQELWRTSV